MLCDVSFGRPDPVMSMVLSLIGSGGSPIPQRIGLGMYLSTHWSMDQLGIPLRQRWRESNPEWLDFDTNGVCDTPEQAMRHLNLEARPEPFFVSFVRIRKADQPALGGWRWHKWGEYIGERSPQCEYLHDEPNIDEVFTYSVHELLQHPASVTAQQPAGAAGSPEQQIGGER